MAYAKLFATITDSSLWGASKEARILFVSMLARADAVGFIEAALPGLARMANLTISETETALAEIMAPDPYSKSVASDGRRVVKVDRGWCLVNYEAYRLRRDEEERREYMRKYMEIYRKEGAADSVNSVNKSKLCKPQLAKAEAEAEGEGERESKRPALALLKKLHLDTKGEAPAEWRTLAHVDACCDTAGEILEFIEWAVDSARGTGKDVSYARHCLPQARVWKREERKKRGYGKGGLNGI